MLPETALYDVSVEYRTDPIPRGGAGEPKGVPVTVARRAACAVEVSIVPSVEISDLSVRIVYGPERCLLLAGVVNRSSSPLTAVCCVLDEVALDHAGYSSSESSRGRLVAIPPANQRLLELELTADVFDRAGAVIRFGRTADALHGLLKLPTGAVRATLSPAVMSMLRPHNITATISVSGDQREVDGQGDDGPWRPKEVTLGEGGLPVVIDRSSTPGENGSSGFMPIVVARVGEALNVAVELKSEILTPCTASYTVWAEPVVLRAIGGEDEASPVSKDKSPMAILPVVEEGWVTDSALDLGMAWNGVVRDAMLQVPAGGTAIQRLSLSCWQPGWYRLELTEVRILDAIESKSDGSLGCVSTSLSAVSAAPGTSARVIPAFLHVKPDE